MNSHYIPRLLLKQFATKEKVNIYDCNKHCFATKKVKNTFADRDIFDEELERAFATRLEGSFANLLNHKLLHEKVITINRQENILIRKFLMINCLRAPIINNSWREMVEKTRLQEHPSVLAREFLIRHMPEFEAAFEANMPSDKTYEADLKKAMEIGSLEELAFAENRKDISGSLRMSAQHAMVSVISFWDCEESGQEFIFPKLQGISQMDYVSIFHKNMVLNGILTEKRAEGIPDTVERELERLIYGSMLFTENFSVYPISPTRILVCFSPYFRAFFPMKDATGTRNVYPPLLGKEQFDRHFFGKKRMELFEPCENTFNQYYRFTVRQLTAEETMEINAILLDMETDEFVFHDFNKIRDTFWYYDHKVKLAGKKKHDFSHLE